VSGELLHLALGHWGICRETGKHKTELVKRKAKRKKKVSCIGFAFVILAQREERLTLRRDLPNKRKATEAIKETKKPAKRYVKQINGQQVK